MTDPLASVIIPAYNGERFLAEAIESALAQTFDPVEVVVVDDGSSDGSAELAESYEGVRVLRKENGGPASARNAGVRASRGEILAFTDQDDLMTPTRLAAQTAPLLDGSGAEVTIAPDQEVILEDGAEMPDWDRVLAPAVFAEFSDGATLICSNSIVTLRSTFERIGPFDEGIFGGDDLDWKLRALESGAGLVAVQGHQVTRRIHKDNISQDFETCRQALLSCFRARLVRRRRSGFKPTDRLGPAPAQS